MKKEWKKVIMYVKVNGKFKKIKFDNYLVSNDGQIVNIKRRKLLKQGTDKDGYKKVELYKDGIGYDFRVHRIVGFAFLKRPLIYKLINHKNGKKI